MKKNLVSIVLSIPKMFPILEILSLASTISPSPATGRQLNMFSKRANDSGEAKSLGF